jgi:hypothetical protein
VKTTTRVVSAGTTTTLDFDSSSVATEVTVADVGLTTLYMEIWEDGSLQPLMSSTGTAEPLLQSIGTTRQVKIAFCMAGVVGSGGGGLVSPTKRASSAAPSIQNNVIGNNVVLFASAHRVVSVNGDKDATLNSATKMNSRKSSITIDV